METKQAEKIRIESITIKWEVEEDADLSWLKSTIDESRKIDSVRYTQEELDKHPRRTRRYIKEDMDRLAKYGDSWVMLGCHAEAEVSYSIGKSDRRIEWFRSGGLWGIESDSDEAYKKSVEQDELKDLKAHLEHFNVDTSNFDKIEVKRKEA